MAAAVAPPASPVSKKPIVVPEVDMDAPFGKLFETLTADLSASIANAAWNISSMDANRARVDTYSALWAVESSRPDFDIEAQRTELTEKMTPSIERARSETGNLQALHGKMREVIVIMERAGTPAAGLGAEAKKEYDESRDNLATLQYEVQRVAILVGRMTHRLGTFESSYSTYQGKVESFGKPTGLASFMPSWGGAATVKDAEGGGSGGSGAAAADVPAGTAAVLEADQSTGGK